LQKLQLPITANNTKKLIFMKHNTKLLKSEQVVLQTANRLILMALNW